MRAKAEYVLTGVVGTIRAVGKALSVGDRDQAEAAFRAAVAETDEVLARSRLALQRARRFGPTEAAR